MKRDDETMIEIVEALANGTQSLRGAALSCAVAERTLWTWLKNSRDGDDRFLIRWPDPEGEPIQLYRAVSMARKMHALEVRSKFERECLAGYDSEVRFQGQVVNQLHAGAYNPKQRELLVMLGECDEEGYRLNAKGERMPVLEHHHAPVAAVTKFLETHFPEYRTHSIHDTRLTVNGGLTLGVSTVPQRTRADGPPAIPAPPTPPRVVEVIKTIPVASVEPTDEADEDDLDVTGTKPVVDEPEVISASLPVPEPERVIREPATGAYTPSASDGRPMSPLKAELLQRLKGPVSLRSASPIGSIKSTLPLTTRPSDD